MNNPEDKIKEIAYIAWKAAANAYKMYPDNKHTFAEFWDTSKSEVLRLNETKEVKTKEEIEKLAEEYSEIESAEYIKKHDPPEGTPMGLFIKLINLFKAQSKKDFISGFTSCQSQGGFTEEEVEGIIDRIAESGWTKYKGIDRWKYEGVKEMYDQNFVERKQPLVTSELLQLYLKDKK